MTIFCLFFYLTYSGKVKKKKSVQEISQQRLFLTSVGKMLGIVNCLYPGKVGYKIQHFVFIKRQLGANEQNKTEFKDLERLGLSSNLIIFFFLRFRIFFLNKFEISDHSLKNIIT